MDRQRSNSLAGTYTQVAKHRANIVVRFEYVRQNARKPFGRIWVKNARGRPGNKIEGRPRYHRQGNQASYGVSRFFR